MDEATSGLIISLTLGISFVVSALVYLMADMEKTPKTVMVSGAIFHALMCTIPVTIIFKIASRSNLASSVVGFITFCIAVFVAYHTEKIFGVHRIIFDY